MRISLTVKGELSPLRRHDPQAPIAPEFETGVDWEELSEMAYEENTPYLGHKQEDPHPPGRH